MSGSSCGSCSPGNSVSSPRSFGPEVSYDDFMDIAVGEDPYAPGYTPTAPFAHPSSSEEEDPSEDKTT